MATVQIPFFMITIYLSSAMNKCLVCADGQFTRLLLPTWLSKPASKTRRRQSHLLHETIWLLIVFKKPPFDSLPTSFLAEFKQGFE